MALRDLNLERLQTVLHELEATDESEAMTANGRKLADYYQTFMDEKSIEENKLNGLKELIEVCDNAKVCMYLYLCVCIHIPCSSLFINICFEYDTIVIGF